MSPSFLFWQPLKIIFMRFFPLPPSFENMDAIIKQAMAEDIGNGDLTSLLTITPDQRCQFEVRNRTPLIVCGLPIIQHILTNYAPDVRAELNIKEGDFLETSSVILSGEGNAHTILRIERVLLNFLQHLSGIASYTYQFVQAISHTKAKILDTRKTLPGLRSLQKYAVRVGGGYNHRLRLDDGILIKDNHIAVAGSLTKAVTLAKRHAPFLTSIEVECDTLEQVTEALSAKVDRIMLDNMSLELLQQAVQQVNGRIPLEASGNISLKTVREVAETGVDFISVGKLTHSVPAADIGLDIQLKG